MRVTARPAAYSNKAPGMLMMIHESMKGPHRKGLHQVVEVGLPSRDLLLEPRLDVGIRLEGRLLLEICDGRLSRLLLLALLLVETQLRHTQREVINWSLEGRPHRRDVLA